MVEGEVEGGAGARSVKRLGFIAESLSNWRSLSLSWLSDFGDLILGASLALRPKHTLCADEFAPGGSFILKRTTDLWCDGPLYLNSIDSSIVTYDAALMYISQRGSRPKE